MGKGLSKRNNAKKQIRLLDIKFKELCDNGNWEEARNVNGQLASYKKIIENYNGKNRN